jgi:hypothetical protein
MKIDFPAESFANVKLFVGTPMYGGICNSNYLTGIVDLFTTCTTKDESLIQRGRNDCAAAFLESTATHLLFIDADVGFAANDVLSLVHTMESDKEKKYDVLAGPYPKKSISWKKVIKAVEQGLAKQDPSSLQYYVGDYTFLAPPGKPFSLKEPAEVLRIGTGFMLIPRRTLEKFIKAYPEKHYFGAKGKKQYAFFDCGIDPLTKQYLAEDCAFCYSVRNMGGRIWLAPWLRLSHQGSYTFQGSLAHIAAIGMAPADMD